MLQNKPLFKFRAFNKSSIELLVNRELWFAKPDSLNDPFECPFDEEQLFSGIDGVADISKAELSKHKQRALKQFNALGICSFSRARKNQLMWAHYADEHKGFCIGFREKALLDNEPAIKSIDVKYQADLPESNVINDFHVNDQNEIVGKIDSEVFYRVIGTKYTNWKYERETRLVLPESKASKFLPTDVRSIAFGLRMSQRDKDTLITLMSGSDWKHLKWYQAVKSPGRFALDFVEIKI